MSKLKEFTTVNGVEVLLAPGRLGVEPSLHYYEGKKLVDITLSSNDFENGLGVFRLHTGLSGEQRKFAEAVMNHLAEEVHQVGHWTDYKIKKEYHDKLMDTIMEIIETEGY